MNTVSTAIARTTTVALPEPAGGKSVLGFGGGLGSKARGACHGNARGASIRDEATAVVAVAHVDPYIRPAALLALVEIEAPGDAGGLGAPVGGLGRAVGCLERR